MKILCIVQARMGSNRLPGKVLKDIDGHPMIYYTLTRLIKSKYIDEIVLATSNKEIDDPLEEYTVKELKMDVFRGSENNVLERYKLCCDKYKGDIIIRITGDCPLIDPCIVDNVITKFLVSNYDYVRLDVPDTFFRGFDVEVFSRETLEKVFNIVSNDKTLSENEYKSYIEHVTYYIYNHSREFKIGYVRNDKLIKEKTNYSVDTEEDFERVKKIISENAFVEYRQIEERGN